VRQLSGGFIFDSLHVQLRDFTIETAASRINQSVLLSYSSLDALKNLPGTVNVKATIGDSHIAISDLLFFQPSLPIKNTPGASIRFSSQLSGLIETCKWRSSRLERDDFHYNLISPVQYADTRCRQRRYYDVNLRLLFFNRNDIQALVADTLLPKNIVFPASIRAVGNFKGTLKNFSASTAIATSIGSLKGNAALTSGKGPSSESSQWKTDVIVEEFDVGSLLGDPETFGPVSLKASAAGTGLNKR